MSEGRLRVPGDGRLRILYNNRVARAGTDIRATSAATPARRVGQVRPGRKWRAAAPGRQVLWIDFGARVAATHGAILGHNLGVAGNLRWTVTDDPAAETDPDGTANTLDLTTRPWDPAYGLGFDPFGESLGGFPDLSDFAAFPARKVVDYGGQVRARYLRIEIFDPLLAVPVEAGVVLHGQGFEPADNIAFGWSVEWRDPAEQIETEGGLLAAPAGKPRRAASFALDHLRREAALFTVDDLNRIAGLRRPVLVELWAGADQATDYRTAVYGLFTDIEPVTHADPLAYAAGWTVQELPDG